MTRKRSSNVNLKKGNHKRSRKVVSCRLWSELPEDLLNMISKRLDLIDYLAFGGVCKGWRSSVSEQKHDFMVSQPPFVVTISTHAKRACSFHNLANGNRCKAVLPRFSGKFCSESACGYLVMQGRNEVWFVNPITRHELHFPRLPTYSDHIIIASSVKPSPDFVSVAVFRFQPFLLFCRSREINWTVFSYADKPWVIADVAVFKGKLYAVTTDATIGVLNLKPRANLSLLEVKSIPTFSSYLLLVPTDEQLLMVDFCSSSEIAIYELNFLTKEWVKIKNLGDKALFLNNIKGFAVNNPSRWGIRSNCIYYVGFVLSYCSCYTLDGKLIEKFSTVLKDHYTFFLKPSIWYFPHLCYKVDTLLDD